MHKLKLLMIAALSAMTLGLTACGDDDEPIDKNGNIGQQGGSIQNPMTGKTISCIDKGQSSSGGSRWDWRSTISFQSATRYRQITTSYIESYDPIKKQWICDADLSFDESGTYEYSSTAIILYSDKGGTTKLTKSGNGWTNSDHTFR